MPVQTFLNPEIQGDRTLPPEPRTFNREGKIESPRYDAKYLETFPTVWAAAYEFQRLIQLYGEGGIIDAPLQVEAQRAVGEWVCLFLLHFFGIVNAHTFRREDFNDYDEDLWPALSRTYPYQHKKELTGLTLLMADDGEQIGEGTVVGAFYEDVFLFPSRGRSTWNDSPVLQPYLQGLQLSWEKCRTKLLEKERDCAEFSTHLFSIENALDGQYRKALTRFREGEVRAQRLLSSGDAYANPLSRRVVVTNAEQLMASYPLVWEVIDKDDPTKIIERTYYLVDGLPHEPRDGWMRATIGRGLPAPRSYALKNLNERKIIVRHAGQEISYELKDGDNDNPVEQVVMLKRCFLSINPFWCGIAKDSNAFAAKILDKHKLKGDWNQQPFTTMSDGEMPVCLAPVNGKFLHHFSTHEIFEESNSGMLKGIESVLTKVRNKTGDEEVGVDWFFTLRDRTGKTREIRWTTNIEFSGALPNNTVALWPPSVSEEWSFYVARGYGALKTDGGRWVIVDEHGKYGNPEELDKTEYVSIIPKPDRIANTTVANRPKSLLLFDAEGQERGVLFLSGLQNRNFNPHAQASLAIDFGTSNTCLAYEVANARDSLVFSLAPVMLWGKRPKELPGFVPSNWPGKKFFPTILLSRKNAAGLDHISPSAIEARYLFQVDIPVLHKDMEERLYTGAFADTWMIQDNMKWKLRVEHPPWRALFLGLSSLYAHAEMFFKYGESAVKIQNYVFTYPLAFDKYEVRQFLGDAQEVTNKIRSLCYREAEPVTVEKMDESRAIAFSIDSAGSPDTLDVFIDVGGGTADIAVRYLNDFPVRDSIKIAGQTFFQFAKENFDGEPKGHDNFKLNLGRILFKQEQPLSLAGVSEAIDLGTYYSLAISRLDKKEFVKREAVVRQNVGKNGYQFYRTAVFFRHILAYGLLQACAAAINNEANPNKIRLILAGNAWGLLLFAGLERNHGTLEQQAIAILKLLQKYLAEALEKDSASSSTKEDKKRKSFAARLKALSIISVELLNEADLETAKTSVAKGALKGQVGGGGAQANEDGTEAALAMTESYAGLSVGRIEVGKNKSITVNWFNKWTLESFGQLVRQAYGPESGLSNVSTLAFEPLNDTSKPFDPLLYVFTRLANLDLYDSKDLMTEADWNKINARLRQDHSYHENGDLTRTPINFFISGVLYPEKEEHVYLQELAAKNKCL